MQKKKIKNNRGITLIALVITIIILLILAGVSIALVAGNNGILGRAEDASRISEIKTIEEFARLSYMDRQINEVMTGETATIAGVISDLKAEGYKIKQEAGVGNNLTGIALSENNVVLSRNGEKTITYTLVYAQGETVKYFIEVQGKYYEIEFNGGNITVNTEEADFNTAEKEPEIVVESSNSGIIEAKKTEEGKILLTAKGEVGDVEITVREVNSNVTNTITATTKTAVAGVSISQTEATVKIGETITLTATVVPSDATNQAVTWTSSDESIATVTGEGVVTGVAEGTAIVTVTTADGNKTAECILTIIQPVTGVSLNISTKSMDIGETLTLMAIVSPNNANNKNVIWSSSDESIATVSDSGVVTAKATGIAEIIVKTVDGEKTAKCTVTVNAPYLVDVVEIGTYVSGGTVNGGNWRVLSKSGSGASGVVKLVSANVPIKYYFDRYPDVSINALQDLTEEYASWKNINYVDQTKGCHAFGCGTNYEDGTGSKATVYSPLNEIETLYQVITGQTKTMKDFYYNYILSESELQKVAGSKWKSIYAGLVCCGESYWLGGASYNTSCLWLIMNSGYTKHYFDERDGIRPVVSLQAGVKVSNTNLGDGSSVEKAYTLTK